jgi:hypothetical protein
MAGFKPISLASNRAIHASEERGMDVPVMGTMKPLRPSVLTAPKAIKAPKTPKIPGSPKANPYGKRKYYGE